MHLVKGSPICILTATITHSELALVSGMLGRKRDAFLVAAGPILSHIKINIVRRPSSSVHFLGNYLPDGSILPGDLQFLDTLVLGDFKRRVKQGTLAGFPKTIIFFRQADTFKCFSGFPWLINTCVRSSENLVMVNSHLLNVLGKQSLDSSPWAMNHASMTPTDEAFLMTRKNEYSLWLTTPRMLLGELGKLRAYFTFFQE